MKKNLIIILLALIQFSAYSQDEKSYERLMALPIKKEIKKNGDVYLQGDFTQIITGTTNKKEILEETLEVLEIANAPHPSVGTIKKYLKEASKEFNVPFPIIDAIAKTYNNYCMIGPSEYGSYGIMGLVESEYSNNLSLSAKLINAKEDEVKSNPRQNIRAAAALLAYYGKGIKNSIDLMEWFEAVKEFTGLNDAFTKEMQAIDYYKVMNNGRNTITLWKENAEIKPINNLKISELINNYETKLESKNNLNRGATTGTVDYPSAIGAFTNCNFSGRGGRDIDTWVNHYIAVGTVAGAISHFRNCNAGASAHFIIAVDGKVYQSVKVASKAWHAGASGQPNNERSIGTEHDVTTSTPSNWNNTTMLKASTDLARYYCNKYAIPKTRSLPGIRGHKEMPGTSTDCPYTIPWTTWMNMLNNNTPPPTSNTPVPASPANGATNLLLPINFTYTSPVNAGAFRIQVSTSNSGWTAANGFTSNTDPNTTVVVNASINTNNYYWNETALGSFEGPKAGKTYYYTIRSWDATTGTSNYSAVRT
ncbi:N-acetylmuramoyl-L-alanine amidase, partial [Flavobacterium jejuense]